jgi:hypothetical protein
VLGNIAGGVEKIDMPLSQRLANCGIAIRPDVAQLRFGSAGWFPNCRDRVTTQGAWAKLQREGQNQSAFCIPAFRTKNSAARLDGIEIVAGGAAFLAFKTV